MALILHLTDIHLGGSAADQELDDHKVNLVPRKERANRAALLRNTLQALADWLTRSKQTLDAVAITGDITVQNDEEGFRRLPEILDCLGIHRPPDDQILCVPGNHDVSWKTPPSVPSRYTNFLRHIRSRGFKTPLLDGVDTGVDPDSNLLRLDDGTVELVPLNSSNYCGTVAALDDAGVWDATREKLAEPVVADLKKIFDSLRTHDVSRLSHWQLRAWAEYLSQRDSAGMFPTPIRIGLLHHHLAPVSMSEEIRTFESITNLGQLRAFLRANGFSAVLHGHKHSSAIYCDLVYRYDNYAVLDLEPRRILVVSGSTVGGVDYRKSDVARLLRISNRHLAPEITVYRIPAIEPGSRLEAVDSRRFSLWLDSRPAHSVTESSLTVQGGSVDEVYARLLAAFRDVPPHTVRNDVFCEVAPAPAVVSIPHLYPDIPGVAAANRASWFSELVDWWQRRRTILSGTFTHGERISAFGEARVDQLAEVCRVLRSKAESSRGVIAIYDPMRDIDPRTQRKAPHFSFAQLRIRRTPDGLYLDCIGYFRKQEMRYWWPINVAELAAIHRRVFDEVRAAHNGLVVGSLVTVATLAYASSSCPKVAVPLIDRVLDVQADQLFDLAYALVRTSPNGAPDITEQWMRVLDDLIPAEVPDPDGVPVAIEGLGLLVEEVEKFLRWHDSDALRKVLNGLRSVLSANRTYAGLATESDPPVERHRDWRRDCERTIQQVRSAVSDIMREL